MSKKTLKDANNNPWLIIILGAFFLVAGIAVTIIGTRVEKWVIIVGILFIALGAYLLPYGIYRRAVIKKAMALKDDPAAYKTDATFVKAVFSSFTSRGSSISTGNVEIPTSYKLMIFKKIVYTYTDKDGTNYKAKSILSYAPNQAKYLEEKKTFKILCNGKTSLIVEEVPEAELSFEL